MESVEGYITVGGRPTVLSMRSRTGWEFCGDRSQPSIVTRGWFDEFIYPNGDDVKFIEVK